MSYTNHRERTESVTLSNEFYKYNNTPGNSVSLIYIIIENRTTEIYMKFLLLCFSIALFDMTNSQPGFSQAVLHNINNTKTEDNGFDHADFETISVVTPLITQV